MSTTCPPLTPPPPPELNTRCLHRFMEHPRTPQTRRFPKRRTAAVAIVLFIGRLGDIYVLLSTRAGTLRSYAHDTALPGGKHEAGDADEEGTARREAFEEIGLPMDRETVRCLCMLDPFLTGNDLIVTPVVLLVTDNAINPVLNPDEVTHLFSMPLAAFLYARPSQIPGWHFGIYERLYPFLPDLAQVPPPPPIPYAEENTVDITGEGGKYYEYRDVKWGEGTVRMHRFLTGREGGGVKPVYGLTAWVPLSLGWR